MPGLEEVAQILTVFNRDKVLHKGNDRQDFARITEEPEAEQVPLPETAEIPIAIDTPHPSL